MTDGPTDGPTDRVTYTKHGETWGKVQSHKLKLVTFQFKLVDFTKGHKFNVVTFAQSCDLSKLVTFTKGHKFKLVTFIKGHKFGTKDHKLGPKVVILQKSQVWTQTCNLLKGHKFKLVTFRKGHKFGPKLVTFLNNSQIIHSS